LRVKLPGQNSPEAGSRRGDPARRAQTGLWFKKPPDMREWKPRRKSRGTFAEMSTIDDPLAEYRRQRDAFRWDIPDTFNFGRDVVDVFARDPDLPAVLWRNAAGSERRLGFAQIRDASNRLADLLRTLGIGPLDPIIVMLPRVPEWQIVTVAFRLSSIMATGLPRIGLRPITTACLPSMSIL
jgi:non-ribosomal peptide synthetase component E (peptide arylation enzyme)